MALKLAQFTSSTFNMILFFRSVISRAIPDQEIGRVFSVLALFSAASGSLIEAGFQKIYNASLEVFPGTYLLVLAGLVLITIPVNVVLRTLVKIINRSSENV